MKYLHFVVDPLEPLVDVVLGFALFLLHENRADELVHLVLLGQAGEFLQSGVITGQPLSPFPHSGDMIGAGGSGSFGPQAFAAGLERSGKSNDTGSHTDLFDAFVLGLLRVEKLSRLDCTSIVCSQASSRLRAERREKGRMRSAASSAGLQFREVLTCFEFGVARCGSL